MQPTAKRLLTALVGALGALLASLTSMEGGMDMTIGQLGDIPLVAWLGVLMAFMTGYLNGEDLRMPGKNTAALLVAALVLPLVMSLPGCASLPIDTLNKRIAAFEITYGQVLETLDTWKQEERLTGAPLLMAQAQVKEMKKARAAMYVALSLEQLATAQDELTTANIILTQLRQYIAEQEKRQ